MFTVNSHLTLDRPAYNKRRATKNISDLYVALGAHDGFEALKILTQDIKSEILPEAQQAISKCIETSMLITVEWESFKQLQEIEVLHDYAFASIVQIIEFLIATDAANKEILSTLFDHIRISNGENSNLIIENKEMLYQGHFDAAEGLPSDKDFVVLVQTRKDDQRKEVNNVKS